MVMMWSSCQQCRAVQGRREAGTTGNRAGLHDLSLHDTMVLMYSSTSLVLTSYRADVRQEQEAGQHAMRVSGWVSCSPAAGQA
jgi:hypothetical protein